MDRLELPFYGVQFASNLLEIPCPRIVYLGQSQLPNPTITAIYLPETKEIVFNEDWVVQTNGLEVMATLFHECRHAYQHHCIETNSYETKETISQWEREFAEYFQPSKDKIGDDDVDYLQQSIEIDSIAFSSFLTSHFLKAESIIPEVIHDGVKEQQLKHLKKYGGKNVF